MGTRDQKSEIRKYVLVVLEDVGKFVHQRQISVFFALAGVPFVGYGSLRLQFGFFS